MFELDDFYSSINFKTFESLNACYNGSSISTEYYVAVPRVTFLYCRLAVYLSSLFGFVFGHSVRHYVQGDAWVCLCSVERYKQWAVKTTSVCAAGRN